MKKKRIDITDDSAREKAMNEFEVKNEADLEILLGSMAESGMLKESYDEKSNDLIYSLTEEGIVDAEKMLRTDDGALYFFSMFMNMTKDKYPDSHERLVRCALFFKRHLKINLLRIIQRNQRHIKGLRLRTMPESLLKEFD